MSRTIATEITISAPVERVWTTLTDLDSYPEWNPFIVRAKGSPEVGERLELAMVPGAVEGGRPTTMRPRVLASSGRQLRWLGHLGIPGIFDGEHVFELQDLGDDTTRLVQREHFRGLLVPFTRSFLEGKTRAGFEAMNRSLKERVEGDGGPHEP